MPGQSGHERGWGSGMGGCRGLRRQSASDHSTTATANTPCTPPAHIPGHQILPATPAGRRDYRFPTRNREAQSTAQKFSSWYLGLALI